MKENCCVCGKPVRMSVLLGDTGQRLSDGVACYDCCKIAGYGKGVLGAIGLALVTKAEFTQRYYSSPKAKQKEKQSSSRSFDAFQNRADIIDYSKLSFEQLQEELGKFVVNSGINLKSGEICYFATDCCSVKYKDVVVGTSRTSTHFGSGKKGLYLGSGLSQQTNNRQIVSEKYPGDFYVTNKRMICTAVKLSFEIPLTSITTMTTYSDGLTVMASGKTYNVVFSDIDRFKKMIQINNEIEKRRSEDSLGTRSVASNTAIAAVNEADIPKLIREYKKLFDEGIISEAEFNQKKEQLLSGNIAGSLVPQTTDTHPFTESSTESFEDKIRNMFSPKETVKAIKYVREETGWELKEAKDFVDRVFCR